MAIYIPPRGSKRPDGPLPKKPVVLPPKVALDHSAFNKSVIAPKESGLKPINSASGGGRLTPLPEAKLTGIMITVDELLQKHPLPLLPTGEPFILHGWQVEDIETLIQWDRVGVFLPVGAGKTVIATMVALAWGDTYRVVVLPPILIGQWVRWINSIPNSGGAVGYRGTPKQRMAIDLTKFSWWVMSDQIFKNDFHHLFKVSQNQSATLIKDEAQGIKNSGSKIWKACNTFSLGRKLLLATGTELNSPADSYAYVKIKTPSVYRSYGQFENIHVSKRDFFNNPISWGHLDLMRENLYLQSVQRTKEQVHAHLPKANYIPFPYELDPEHLKLYRQLTEQQIIELDTGGKIDATTQQNLYIFSQQLIVNWADFCGKPDVRPAVFDVIDMCLEQMEVGQHPKATKFIIWTWFKPTTKRVKAYCETRFPGRVAVAFSESNSVKEVARFMDDPDCLILVAQPGSAGAGLNPQYICWGSLFVEVPTRTIPFRQAAGRVDREGQQFNANIWIAQAEGTIQTFLYNNLLNNDALVQKVQGSAYDLRRVIHGM